jgi:glycosyltransferase involved in cell wall biosynthesis
VNGGTRGARLRIALVGTRGVPAHYGGFETAVEEIGRRLATVGHDVTVYCRRGNSDDPDLQEHLGMRIITLPAVRLRAAETLSHSALATLHVLAKGRYDVVFLFNSANAVFLPVLRRRRTPVAVHVDGLEWRRAKWSGAGRQYYRRAESLAVRWADALIADAPGIAEYYADEFGASTELLTYGAPILDDLPADGLAELRLEPGRYHLVVARFEPENHVHVIVQGYRSSAGRHPLVVVGGAPYNDEYEQLVRRAAGGDDRIRLLGSVWDQGLLDRLYGHARQYLHGHSAGGTNPSLLRAMGAGTAVGAYDVGFNRGVLGEHGRYFEDAAGVAALVEAAEADPAAADDVGRALRARAQAEFSWDDVATGYEALATRLANGYSRRGEVSGRRRGSILGRSHPRSEAP